MEARTDTVCCKVQRVLQYQARPFKFWSRFERYENQSFRQCMKTEMEWKEKSILKGSRVLKYTISIKPCWSLGGKSLKMISNCDYEILDSQAGGMTRRLTMTNKNRSHTIQSFKRPCGQHHHVRIECFRSKNVGLLWIFQTV